MSFFNSKSGIAYFLEDCLKRYYNVGRKKLYCKKFRLKIPYRYREIVKKKRNDFSQL